MTTYTLEGFGIEAVPSGSGGIITNDAYEVTLDFVVADGADTFMLAPGAGSNSLLQAVGLIPSNLLSLNVNGVGDPGFFQNALYLTDIEIFSDSSITLYVVDQIQGIEFFFTMSGDPLPDVRNTADARSFFVQLLAGGSFSSTLPSEYAFFTDLDYASFAGFSQTEDDLIFGTSGADNLAAGLGNDTLEGGFGDDTLTGGDGDDELTGSFGKDELRSDGRGADTLSGGSDIDTLIFDSGSAGAPVAEIDLQMGQIRIDGDTAHDRVSGIENVEISGTQGARVLGSSLANSLTGNVGDDMLLGGAGDDTLAGGDGDDTLDGGMGGDAIDGGAGRDTVSYESATRSVRVDLQNPALMFNDAVGDTFTDVEVFRTGGTIDQLRGDAQSNEFHTGGLSDRLYGRAGDDLLFGEGGADAFYGGLGADTMTAGDDAGRGDRFIYFNIAESGVGAGNRDVITDFVSGEDRIEISRFDADVTQGFKQRFDFVGDAAFTGTAGELRFEQAAGVTLVQADVDGDGMADFEVELTGTIDLQADDFLI
ncbi:MAG: calcium-binding protein [Roseovarius sp.]